MKKHLEQHPKTIHPIPKEAPTTAIDQKTVAKSPHVLPTVTSETTSTTGSETPTASAAAATTTSTVADAPPEMNLPTVPPGFTPIDLQLYRGYRPNAGQLAAMPGAVTELQSSETTLPQALGPNVPDANQLATKMDIAIQWTSRRAALEALLAYVMSNQAIAWKDALTTLDQLGAIFEANVAHNPKLPLTFPKTAKLLDATKEIAQRRAAKRARKSKATAKANAAIAATVASTTATTTPAAPSATNPGTTTPAPANAAPANGGAAH